MVEREWTVVAPRGRKRSQRATSSSPAGNGAGKRSAEPRTGTKDPFLRVTQGSQTSRSRPGSQSRSRSKSKSPSHSTNSLPLSQGCTTTQWMDALLSGDEDRVRDCLEQGADINSVQSPKPKKGGQVGATGQSPLEIAAIEGWYGVTDLLLKSGADPGHYAPALRAMAQREHTESFLSSRGNPAKSRKKLGRYQAVGNLIRLWDFSHQGHEAAYPGLHALLECSQSKTLPGVVTCQWEVIDVVKAARTGSEGVYDPGVLSRLVVLTGLDGEYEATTCEEYLRREWGDIGLEVLDWIIFGLGIAMGITSARETPSTCFLQKLTATPSYVEIHCKGNLTLKKRCGVIDALTWVCEAVRMPTRTDAGFRAAASTSSCRLLQSMVGEGKEETGEAHGFGHSLTEKLSLKLAFSLEPLSPLPATENQCWLPLFKRCVVSARRAKDRPNGFGRGLEASFGRLTELAAIELLVPIDEGSVFAGYQTVLVPYGFKRLPNGESLLQFHLEHSRKHGQVDPFYPRTPRSDPILRNDEYEINSDTRCFLGWCRRGHINLGTKALLKNPGYSQTKTQGKTLHLKGLSIGGQAVSGGVLQSGLTAQATGEYVSNILRFTPHTSYPKMLNGTSKEVAVVIDNATHRSWMVPKLSLLLYMAHCWLQAGAPGLIRQGSIPYVNPHHDGNEVAERLSGHGENIVCAANTDDAMKLRTLLLGLNTNLICSRSLTEPAGDARVFQDGHIFAFEFLDLVEEPGRGTAMRKVLVGDSGWLQICHNADAVVVCENLGDVITPDPACAKRLPACNVLPSDQHYLATTVSCLQQIARGGGWNASSRMYLELRGEPFTECKHDEKGLETCWEREDLFQGIVKPSRIGKKGKNKVGGSLEDLPKTGILVFGKKMKGKGKRF